MTDIKDLLIESDKLESKKDLAWLIIGQLMISVQSKNTIISTKKEFIEYLDSFVDYQSSGLVSLIKKEIYKVIALIDNNQFSKIINVLSDFSDSSLINASKYLERLISPRFLSTNILQKNFLDLLVKLGNIEEKDKVLDPSSNTSNIWEHIIQNNIHQDIFLESSNLLMSAITYVISKFLKADGLKIYQGNSLKNPKYVNDGELQLFDKIISLPPLGERLDVNYMEDKYNRFKYGKLSKTRMDMAYISNIVSSLNQKGKALVMVPDGVLFRSSWDEKVRRNLIKQDLIETVISFSNKFLSNTMIPINILIINRNKNMLKDKILFIDANQKGWVQRNKFVNDITEKGEERIIQLYKNPESIKGISKIISNSKVKSSLIVKNYVLPLDTKINGVKYEINYDNIDKFKTIKLKKIITMIRGYNVLKKDMSNRGNISAIKGTDLNNGKVNYEGLSKINVHNNADKYLLQPNDILLTIKGDVGKVAIVSKTAPFPLVATSNLVILRSNGKVNPQWLKLYLESTLGQFYIKKGINSSISVLSISSKDVEEIPIPVFSIEEQQRMARYYESKKDILDRKMQEINRQYDELKADLDKQIDVGNILKRE